MIVSARERRMGSRHPAGCDCERCERIRADHELVGSLAAHDFEGPEYERFEEVLIQYGTEKLLGWLRTKRIFAVCKHHDIGVSRLHSDRLMDEDMNELAWEVVHRRLESFRQDLVDGRWLPDGGAELKSYFIRGLLPQFANVYRKWQRAEDRRRRAVEAATRDATRDRQANCFPNPEAATVRSMTAEEELATIGDPKMQVIFAYKAIGYSHAEIAELLEDDFGGHFTARAVEGLVYRYARKRRSQNRAGKEGKK